METKNYKLEILYDNGIIETYETGEVTEEEILAVLNVPYETFEKGLSAVLQVPNGTGHNALINLSKVTRISLLP